MFHFYLYPSHRFFRQLQACLLFVLFSWPVLALSENALPLDVNQAGVALLAERLPGIGPAKARAIVTFREENGLFKSVDALLEVKGIGPATLKKIRGLLSVGVDSPNKSGPEKTAPASSGQQSQSSREAKTKNAVRAAVNMAKRFPKTKTAEP